MTKKQELKAEVIETLDESTASEETAFVAESESDSTADVTVNPELASSLDSAVPTAAGSVVRHRSLIFGGDDPADKDLEETVISEDLAWKGKIFGVNRLQVSLPDGCEGTRDVIRHPGAVAIVALTDEGEICLVRQWRSALERVTVEIPAGKLELGEDPVECAQRELLEETGIVAGKIKYLTTIANAAGYSDELIQIFMATQLSFTKPAACDDDEFIRVDLVPLEELIDAVLDGSIEDVKTVVAALLCDAIAHRLS